MDIRFKDDFTGKPRGLTPEMREQYAKDLFGAEMEQLGFNAYKRPLWYKLIRDEVLLAFGLSPSVSGTYELIAGFFPMFALKVPPNAESINSIEPPFLCNVEMISSNMKGQTIDSFRILDYTYPPDKPFTVDLYTRIALPAIRRAVDLRSAYQEAMWLLYNWRRDKHTFPTHGIHLSLWSSLDMILPLCFFRMYDDALAYLQEMNEGQKSFGLRAFGEYQDALERQDYGWLDTKLHENYAANLKAIKRRLKLDPDCKDTIWDRDLRHPVDVDGLIHERFKKRAIKNSEGNYTITEI